MATAVLNETNPEPKSLPTAALAYKFVTFVNRMATDSGSGASKDLSSWRPNLDAGWYYLGQGAEWNWDHAPTGIIVHALEADALRDVVRWEKVWDDQGSHKSTDFSLWRGVPPNEDYVVVGGIFSTNKGWAEPDSEQTRGIKAIRRDLVVMDDTFEIWNDKGTHAAKDGSVWKTLGRTGASPSALIPMYSHSAPPRDISFSLDRSKTLLIGSRSTPYATDEFPISEGAKPQKEDVDGSQEERKE